MTCELQHGPYDKKDEPSLERINYVQKLLIDTFQENSIPLDYSALFALASTFIVNCLMQKRCANDIISVIMSNLQKGNASFESIPVRKPS